MFNPGDFPLCEREIERVNKKFVDRGWITLYEDRVFAVMVNDALLETAMEDDTWELGFSDTRPLINENRNTAWGYSKLYHQGIEPLVVIQEEKSHHKMQVRLCEEMVLFYDLRIVNNQGGDYDYVMVDEAGYDVVVARYEKGTLVALVKFVKEFIAVKELNLLVQFQFMNSHAKHLVDLGLAEHDFAYYKDTGATLSYSLKDDAGLLLGHNTTAILTGKTVFRHDNADIKLLWHGHEDGYEDFIVGLDDNGDEITSTCDEHIIPNLFTRKGDEVYALSPAYFKREVLK